MEGSFAPAIYKHPSASQRADLRLTPAIAGALAHYVISGQKLFPGEGTKGAIELWLEGKEAPILLSRSTLKSWIHRGNKLPDGTSLRAFLERAKEIYRARKIEERRIGVLDRAEGELNRTLNIRSNIPLRNAAGQIVTREDGSIVRRENPQLLKIKVDASKFVLDRLDPEHWGKKERKKTKRLAFSLSDLRRYSEEMKKEKEEGIASASVPASEPSIQEQPKQEIAAPSTPAIDFSKFSRHQLQELKEKLDYHPIARKSEESRSYVPTGNVSDPFSGARIVRPEQPVDDNLLSSM